MAVLAYFLTWTTYGTWLHGDERGSVDDEHNGFGEPVVEADDVRRGRVAGRMVEGRFVLDGRGRVVVERAVLDHAEVRRWRVDALAVRSNHVHVVVAAPGYSPETVAGQFKSWATRRLRETGLIEGRRRVWTKMGSTRRISTEASRAAAVDYVLNFQDEGRRRFE